MRRHAWVLLVAVLLLVWFAARKRVWYDHSPEPLPPPESAAEALPPTAPGCRSSSWPRCPRSWPRCPAPAAPTRSPNATAAPARQAAAPAIAPAAMPTAGTGRVRPTKRSSAACGPSTFERSAASTTGILSFRRLVLLLAASAVTAPITW